MIDHETMENNTVTVRDRDTMQQVRVSISELHKLIDEKVNLRNLLLNLQLETA